MFDLSHLAHPIDAQSPCGPDCGYDSDFLALSQAVAGKPEQQFGDTIIPAVEPDWRAVEQMASDLLGRTKDLRVVAWLTQACDPAPRTSQPLSVLGSRHGLRGSDCLRQPAICVNCVINSMPC